MAMEYRGQARADAACGNAGNSRQYLRVKALSIALVREFLARNGLTETLKVLTRERPIQADDITTRKQLARSLRMTRLAASNTLSDSPYPSLVEVLVDNIVSISPSSANLTTLDSRSSPSEASNKLPALSNGPTADKKQVFTKHTTSDRRDQLRNVKAPAQRNDRPDPLSHAPSSLPTRPEDAPSNSVDSINSKRATRMSVDHAPQSRSTSNVTQRHQESTSKVGSADSIASDGLTPSAPSSEQRRRRRKAAAQRVRPQLDRGPRPAEKSRRRHSRPEGTSNHGDSSAVESTNGSLTASKKSLPTSKVDLHRQQQQKLEPSSSPDSSDVSSDSDSDSSIGTGEGQNNTTASDHTSTNPAKHVENSSSTQRQTKPSSRSTAVTVGDLSMDDVFDEDLDNIASMPTSNGPRRPTMTGKLISRDEAEALKQIVLGSISKSFPAEWTRQQFVFSNVKGLRCGLVQHKGGPCGVLAAVQATILKKLLFSNAPNDVLPSEALSRLNPSDSVRDDALTEAMAEMLWRAGCHRKTAVVAVSGQKSCAVGPRFARDGITERLQLIRCRTFQEVIDALNDHAVQFRRDDGSGVVHFLYSVVLSRGLDQVRNDMDEKDGKLIGHHFLCTQDLVNLCTTGRAVSNTHDGVKNLGEIRLGGIESQSDVGLLSLFEHYNSCQVGENLKTPKFPIWIVCAESHYSVLFSTSFRVLTSTTLSAFECYYYDELAGMQELYDLSIDIRPNDTGSTADNPLQHCIRTRWPGAVIDWKAHDVLN